MVSAYRIQDAQYREQGTSSFWRAIYWLLSFGSPAVVLHHKNEDDLPKLPVKSVRAIYRCQLCGKEFELDTREQYFPGARYWTLFGTKALSGYVHACDSSRIGISSLVGAINAPVEPI